MLYKILYNESYTVSFFLRKELAVTRTVTCISDIVPGDIFKVNGNVWGHEQAYRIAIPCLVDDKGSIVMQDTYQIDKSFSYDKACKHINNCMTSARIGAWAVNRARCDYYHKCSSILHDSDLSDGTFEFWFNVNDFEVCTDLEASAYADEDWHRGVKLYFEHGYSWTYGAIGVCVRRKNAHKLPEKVLESMINNDILCSAYFTNPYVSTVVFNSLDKLNAVYANAQEQCPKEGPRQEDYSYTVSRMYRALVAIKFTHQAQKSLKDLMQKVTDEVNELPLGDIESKCVELIDELRKQ